MNVATWNPTISQQLALEAARRIVEWHEKPRKATAAYEISAEALEVARALLALSEGEAPSRSDIIEQIRAWYGYDAAFRPIGEAAIAEITRLRPGWRYDMDNVPMDGGHFVVLCTRMDEPPIAWRPYTPPSDPGAKGE